VPRCPSRRTPSCAWHYNRTDYGNLAFETSHGNTDTVNIDNEADQFRLGVGYRF
jgi:opacity protein-like surface antigen